MITFKEYMTEATATRRQGIVHFEKMKDEEFIRFLKQTRDEFKGVLKDMKVVGKLDGAGFRFGKDENGRIFVEGSRTGPIFDEGAFTAYATNKGSRPEVLSIAAHYDNVLKFFKGSSLAKSLPDDTKVIIELFYNPMATIEDNGITFVTVKYDRNKLGTHLSIAPYDVVRASDGEPHPDKDAILKKLYSLSTKEVMVIDPNLSMGQIDISGTIKTLESLLDVDLSILKSRKKVDKERKDSLKALIQSAKDDLAAYILNHKEIYGKDKMGDEIEGIVIHINGIPYKITTPKFKAAIKAKKQ